MDNEENAIVDSGVNTESTTENVNANISDNVSQSASQAAPSSGGEKLLRQSEVDGIVKAVKQKERDKVRTEMMADQYMKGGISQEPAAQQPNVQPGMGYQQNISEDRIKEVFKAESERVANEARGNQIANEITQKISAAKERHPDIDDVISKLNLPSVPHLAVWANGLDNSADVLYEIGQHPSKFANLMILSQQAPQMAMDEMKRLSDSIKKNQQEADQHRQANEPLGQITPSTTGTDNGSMSIEDFKGQDWLRG